MLDIQLETDKQQMCHLSLVMNSICDGFWQAFTNHSAEHRVTLSSWEIVNVDALGSTQSLPDLLPNQTFGIAAVDI